MKEIQIPIGTTQIEDYAFSGNYLLEAVIIPETVKIIGKSAFWGCSKLKELKLPESLTIIKDSVFEGTDIQEITIPINVKYICGNPFAGCSCRLANNSPYYHLLNGILYDNTMKKIISCCNYDKEITIPEGVEEIGDSAFYGCNSLRKLHIPSTVTTIGDYAFAYCESLQIDIDNNVNNIGKNAFEHCELVISSQI